jgi:hypothetical protein
MSFTYADWIIGNSVYVPNSPNADFKTSTLNLTIESRATGTRAFCHWGGDGAVLGAAPDSMILLCSQDVPDRSGNNSVFSIEFRADQKLLSIQQDWICGDSQGKYS